MNVEQSIHSYIESQLEPKKSEMRSLHEQIISLLPKSKLWFEDGMNAEGKVISNPNIGYGSYTIQYANGKTREFFQVGLSANTIGISVYLMGIPDKNFLIHNFKETIGKASVTSYCIKFKKCADINREVLSEAIKAAVTITNEIA